MKKDSDMNKGSECIKTLQDRIRKSCEMDKYLLMELFSKVAGKLKH